MCDERAFSALPLRRGGAAFLSFSVSHHGAQNQVGGPKGRPSRRRPPRAVKYVFAGEVDAESGSAEGDVQRLLR